MNKRTVIMDYFRIRENRVELKNPEEKNGMWKEYCQATNRAAEMYFDLWQKGTLKEIAEYVTKHNEDDGITVIDFVIDVDRLGDAGMEKLCTKYPEMAETLRNCRNWTPCRYANAIGLYAMCSRTYRGSGECVGSSWEHPITQTLSEAGTYQLSEMTQEDPVKGCIELLKAVWGEESKLHLTPPPKPETEEEKLEREAQEFLDRIWDGDLYNPTQELYVFRYNEAGSIAIYGISPEEAEKLAKESKENDDQYWGGFLGPGGWIYDDPSHECYVEGKVTNLDWCREHCRDEGTWYDTETYLEDLEAERQQEREWLKFAKKQNKVDRKDPFAVLQDVLDEAEQKGTNA